jgi:hypothetical protein
MKRRRHRALAVVIHEEAPVHDMKVVIVRGHDLKAKFRAALVGVAAEDGIEEDEVDVMF